MYSCRIPKKAITTMGSMRQRLLLVAGWVAAAVVASLVSTGAVAVAGGQVTDRPLRPLSASEVAALTEECGSTDRAPCLRQLEEPVELTTLVEAAPDLNSSLDGDEQGVSPVSADPPKPPSEDTLDPGADGDESLLPPAVDDRSVAQPRGEVVSLQGGSVGISGADGEVRVIWAIPGPGFALVPLAGTEIQEGAVTLVFSDGAHRSRLEATWDDTAGLVIETVEGRLDLSES
jgi:hypothetical protein